MTSVDSGASTEAVKTPYPDLEERSATRRNSSGELELVGGQCPACGYKTFPWVGLCSRCLTELDDETLLGTSGVLYAFSTVHVSSARQVPYTIGYVDMPGDLRVLGSVAAPAGSLRIGADVVVVDGEDGWGFELAEGTAND